MWGRTSFSLLEVWPRIRPRELWICGENKSNNSDMSFFNIETLAVHFCIFMFGTIKKTERLKKIFASLLGQNYSFKSVAKVQ